MIDGDGSILTPILTVKNNRYQQLYISLLGTNGILHWINNTLSLLFPVQTTRETHVSECTNTIVVNRLSIGGYRALEIINKIKSVDSLPLLKRKWDKTNGLVLGRI